MTSPAYVGIAEGHWDPAVAVARGGKLIAFAEEERFLRLKHAPHHYPTRALHYVLAEAGVAPEEVATIAVGWNAPAYTNGTMQEFFDGMAGQWKLDEGTRAWQRQMLGRFQLEPMTRRHEFQWRQAFGDIRVPALCPLPHHFVHALHAYFQSPFDEALCITIDGSGDQHCTVLWECRGDTIRAIREIRMPHSLGWFYAAITEFLGYEAYDGEYKVMGLAAYGRPNSELRLTLSKVLYAASDGVEYRLDPAYIHYGAHTWSNRFTDALVELLGHPPRRSPDPITGWHRDLAFAAQKTLEEAVCRLVTWGVETLRVGNVCIGGGVALNVKLNSRILGLEQVRDLFAQPLCSDGGAAAGAALAAGWERSGDRPGRLETLALGPAESDAEIEQVLRRCRIPHRRVDDIADTAAAELAQGHIVGWFQGRMEAGPRALGQRSILADPRSQETRDRITRAVKSREPWRPYCPSLPAEDAAKYVQSTTCAPFMNVALDATEALRRDAPSIVHVDNSVRVQLVDRDVLPLFHRLLRCFEQRAGVPVLLNTSFNLSGEPIVCTCRDALRTFYGSAIDALAAGNYIIRKHEEEPDA